MALSLTWRGTLARRKGTSRTKITSGTQVIKGRGATRWQSFLKIIKWVRMITNCSTTKVRRYF